jgi:hypothetical protein
MTTISMIPLLLLHLCAVAGPGQSGASRSHAASTASDSKRSARKESPLACDLSALTPAERKRLGELGPILRQLKTGVRELKGGYEFMFPSDTKTLALVTEWAGQERLCCPFFEIGIRLGRDGGPLAVQLTGRDGTKEFIRDDFAAWFKE